MSQQEIEVSEADRLAIEAASIEPIVRGYEGEVGTERAQAVARAVVGDRWPSMVATAQLQRHHAASPYSASIRVPVLERFRISAQAIVPLVKAFRREIGASRANLIAHKAASDSMRKLALEWASIPRPARLPIDERLRTAYGDALNWKVLRDDEQTLQFNVTGCKFAQLWQELGEPELGFLMVCSMDDTMAEVSGDELTRTQTIMQGGSHCDFLYRLKKRAEQH
jgi:hypothetical protein